MLQSLPDLQALRNLKSINPILRNSHLKGAILKLFWLILREIAKKPTQNASILLPLNFNFLRLGCPISNFSKPQGQAGFGAHSKAKWISHFMQTKYLGRKMSQNTTVQPVSYSSDCIRLVFLHRLCFPNLICRYYFLFTNKCLLDILLWSKWKTSYV